MRVRQASAADLQTCRVSNHDGRREYYVTRGLGGGRGQKVHFLLGLREPTSPEADERNQQCLSC